MELYKFETGQVYTEEQFREEFSDTFFPNPISVDAITDRGFTVVLSSPQPTPNDLQNVIRDGVEFDTKGNVVQKWKLVPKFSTVEEEYAYIAEQLVEAKRVFKNAVEAERARRESMGVPYKFPDDTIGTIQTRNADDIRNVLGVTAAALVLSSQNIDSPVIMFRDDEDVIHVLTPSQAIQMGMFVQEFISSNYSYAWDKKSEIDAATTIEALRQIQL